ncbi:MAG: hypothetical protein ORN85_04660 [Sediminibacterium sp.]|nr:hypothetical protein [Sediminibacterium sp.]
MNQLIIVLLFLQLTSCMNNKKPLNQFDLEQVKKTINEANKIYGDRFKIVDRNWYADKYCKDACVMPEKMNSICGIDSIIKYYYNDGKNKDFIIVIKEVEVFGNQELVVEEGVYDFPNGEGGSFDKGKFIAIWKIEEGKWKIYREIWNSSIEGKTN